MKKLFTILAVMTAVLFSAKAEKLLIDSFPQNVGDLTKTDMLPGPVTNLEWFYTTNTETKIQVIDTALTFNGYCDKPSAHAIQFKGNTNKAIRAISAVTEKSVYYSLLLNVKEVNKSTTKDGIIMLQNNGSVAAGNSWAQLRYLNDYTSGKFQLAISKTNETGVRWISLPTDSTMLVVVRYDFIAGEKNDEVYMWINPTKVDESKPTSWCVQDTASGTGNPYGANTKADASSLDRFMLKPAAHTPNLIIDEIRVATKWAELFDTSAGGDPEIGVSTTLSFGLPYQGTEDSKDLSITASNLKGDIAVSHSHADITLSAATITKAAAEAGATLKVSLKANAVGAQVDTIVLSSEGVEKKVAVSWTTYPVVACANVAALKDSVKLYEAYEGIFRLNGEAVVTRDTTIDDREIYLQDASGAVKLLDSYGKCGDNLVGAKVKGFILNNGEEALGILPFYVAQAPTIVSTGNKVEPQEVSLADLQANAVDYLFELVKIKGVAFADAGESFAVGLYKASQATENVNVKVENNNIVGKEIPVKAHVIGFSFNTSGSVILPRNIDDIIDANPELLKNGSFEDYTEGSSLVGATTTFEDWDASGILPATMAAEKSDVKEGEAAFKSLSGVVKGAYIYQQLNCQAFAKDDEFKVRIAYKNLNNVDSALVLDCYWEANMGGTPIAQAEDLKQALDYSSSWKVVEIKTSKPENANYFFFKIKIGAKAQVLIDDCAFTYVEPTPTAVEESSKSSNSSKCVKVIRNGQLLIERDGVIYNVAGQKL